MTQRILMIRHGQTAYNAEGRWQGNLDVPLDAVGQQQARLLAEHVGRIPLQALYSSDLGRAYATAEAIAQVVNLPIQLDPRLREINLGVFQGRTRLEIQALYADDMAKWDSDDHFVVPNGESRLLLQSRMMEAFNEIADQHQDETIALVTHGGSIRMTLRALFANRQIGDIRIENTSITTLERRHHSWHLLEAAASPHLPG